MILSIQKLAAHVPATLRPFSLRDLLRRPSGPLQLSVAATNISVLSQNMALLVCPGNYLGTDRDGAITEICTRIRALSPDVVGLCEVFSDGERNRIRRAVADLYPHFQEGPDEADLESDGGLLVLSKHPVLETASFIYRDCDGHDCFANKGMIHMRVKAPEWASALDVFYTHAQDISTGNGTATLYAQLTKMHEFMLQRRDPTLPAVIMGDINIPAEDPRHYGQLLTTLAGVRDCWTIAGNAAASGATSIRDSNFYDDSDDRPDRDQRLDYVLIRAGARAVPIVSGVEIHRFARNGRLISDHLAVRAMFDGMVLIHP